MSKHAETPLHVTQTGWKVAFSNPLQEDFYMHELGFIDAPHLIASGNHIRLEHWRADGLTCIATIWPDVAYVAGRCEFQ